MRHELVAQNSSARIKVERVALNALALKKRLEVTPLHLRRETQRFVSPAKP